MRNFYGYVLAALSLTLSGCNTIPNPFTTDKTFAGISPPLVNRKDDDGRVKSELAGVTNEKILAAEAKPFVDYYAALDAAASATGTKEQIQVKLDDYVAKGITVVNVSCLRWFNSLSESQARFAYTQNNQNVIQNLGTTLLGIGKATSAIVGSYGALFTGLNGVENNFSQSFLLAPNANKVKEHIFTALDEQASQLRQASYKENDGTKTGNSTKISLRPESFTEAYMALERYADICTQQTAREIVNSALDQTKTTVLTDQGNKVFTTSTKVSEAAAVSKLSSDVLSLQKDTSNAITKLQNSMDSAVINSDTKKISTQLGELKALITTSTNNTQNPAPTNPTTTIQKTNSVVVPDANAVSTPDDKKPALPSTQK